jgi:hypothetical protein
MLSTRCDIATCMHASEPELLEAVISLALHCWSIHPHVLQKSQIDRCQCSHSRGTYTNTLIGTLNVHRASDASIGPPVDCEIASLVRWFVCTSASSPWEEGDVKCCSFA